MTPFWVWLTVAACGPKRPTADESPANADAEPPPASVPTEVRTPVAGPAAWSAVGLCLAVPSGWSGSGGVAPEVLELQAEGDGPRLSVLVLPDGGSPTIDNPDFVLAYEDLGSYRTVPVIAPSSLRSWQSVVATGPVRMAWWGEAGGRTVAVAVQFAHDHTTEGLDLVQPLLDGLRLCED